MGNPSTFIKLDRNILKWEWYKSPITTHVFIYLILKANIEPGYFLGVEIKRGQVATSYSTIASDCGITYKQARTAVTKLSSKNGQSDGQSELHVRRHSQFIVVTVDNYEKYQSRKAKEGNQMGNQRAIIWADGGQQLKNIKNNKNNKARSDVIKETSDAQKARIERLRNS